MRSSWPQISKFGIICQRRIEVTVKILYFSIRFFPFASVKYYYRQYREDCDFQDHYGNVLLLNVRENWDCNSMITWTTLIVPTQRLAGCLAWLLDVKLTGKR